eukprot:4758641-Pyramimonas_sp.AAC.1
MSGSSIRSIQLIVGKLTAIVKLIGRDCQCSQQRRIAGFRTRLGHFCGSCGHGIPAGRKS